MINLTKVTGCYTKELTNNLATINAQFDNSKVTLNDFKNYVTKIVEPAKFNKVAKPRFMMYIQQCNSKQQLLELVYNSITAATYYRQ